MVEDISNEVSAVPELLRSLERAGCSGTLAAMGRQKQIAREIIESDADYVLALKGNQDTAPEEIRAILDDAIARKHPALASWESVEKGPGRLETRRYWQRERIGWFADCGDWDCVRSAGVGAAVREIDGKISGERRAFVNSLSWDAQRFARAVRRRRRSGHSQLPVPIDVVFNEDQSRAKLKHTRKNLVTLRRWSLSLLKADKLLAKRSIKDRRKNAGWSTLTSFTSLA